MDREIKPTTVCIKVSVLSQHSSAQYLSCQLKWAQPNFERFIFCVADLIQEYDYRIIGHPSLGRLDAATAHRVADQEGRTWIDANLKVILEALPPASYDIVRTNEWRAWEGYQGRLADLVRLYHADPMFSEAVRSDVRDYARRRGFYRSLSEHEYDELARHTLEELTFDGLQAEREATLFLYAGSEPEAYKAIRHHPLAPASVADLDYRYVEIRPSSSSTKRTK